jgi:trk system potassium uptake protein TrkH
MATGGFSPKNASIGHFDSAFIDGVITLFMVLAGANFLIYYKLLLGRRKAVFLDSELKAYLGIFVGATLVVTAAHMGGGVYEGVGESVRYAAFQVASILTTTGYVTADYSLWVPGAQLVLFVLMLCGGSSGSTGGGVKIVRIVALFKQAFTEMKYLLHPRGMFATHMSGNVLRKNVIYAITGFVILYMGLVLLTSVVVAFSGQDLSTSVTTALATIGNIGPGFGAIGPTENYGAFPGWLKLYLSAMMIVGRLEIFTVLIILTPGFWRK